LIQQARCTKCGADTTSADTRQGSLKCSFCNTEIDTANLSPSIQATEDFDSSSQQKSDPDATDFFHNPSELNDPKSTSSRPSRLGERPGDFIGRYRLLAKLGEGGFGNVWLAEQSEPVKRQVAVKSIKAGLDSQEILARFEAERQALAMMEHPNIAQVFDGGSTEAGRPFFVMEVVRGIPITEYCQSNQTKINDRVKMFIDVCHAIQHAHDKGIIHRDLKPSNVLVSESDGKAIPKVIDFGIAKAIRQPLTERALRTNMDQFIGTPIYMSPEQTGSNGGDIDARSDIYAMGGILYELLTAQTPFSQKEFFEGGIEHILKMIREREPPKPSARIRALTHDQFPRLGDGGQKEKARLTNLLSGELDWIAMKCLEKDRNRRYASAKELADDLQRYLENKPIVARPPSALYRMQKFSRRNRTALVFTSLIFFSAASVFWLAARKSYSDRIRTITSQVQQRLDFQVWSQSDLEYCDRLIGSLAEFDAVLANQYRGRVTDRLKEDIQSRIFQTDLDDKNYDEVSSLVGLLSKRDSSLGDKLQIDLDERVRRWNQQISLSPPFANVESASSELTLNEQGKLHFKSGLADFPIELGPNIRVNAEFVTPRDVGGSVAISLKNDYEDSYEFRLERNGRVQKLLAPPQVQLAANTATRNQLLNRWHYTVPGAASISLANGKPLVTLSNDNRKVHTSLVQRVFDAERFRGRELVAKFEARFLDANLEPSPGSSDAFARVGLVAQKDVPPGVNNKSGSPSKPQMATKFIEVPVSGEWIKSSVVLPVPSFAERMCMRAYLQKACGRLELKDIQVVARDLGDASGMSDELILEQPKQEWNPNRGDEQAWFPFCDATRLKIMKEGNEEFIRLTGDPNLPTSEVHAFLKFDPSNWQTISLTGRLRISGTNSTSKSPAKITIQVRRQGEQVAYLSPPLPKKNGWQDLNIKLTDSISHEANSIAIKIQSGLDSAVVDISRLQLTLEGKEKTTSKDADLRLALFRNGRLVRESLFGLESDDNKKIRLTVERKDNSLRCMAGEFPALSMIDPFPPRGKAMRLSLNGEPGVEIQSLAAYSQMSAVKPLPIAKGDDHFRSGEFQKALADYETIAATTANDPMRMEARYKIASCLLELGQDDDAERELGDVVKSEVPIWAIAAGCRLWELYLLKDRPELADGMLSILRSRPDFQQLSACASENLRKKIANQYFNHARSSIELGGPDEWRKAIHRLEDFIALCGPLDQKKSDQHLARWHLTRLLECDRQYDRAYRELELQLNEMDSSFILGQLQLVNLVAGSYARLAIVNEKATQAIPLLKRLEAYAPSGEFSLNLARCFAASNQLEKAIQIVDQILEVISAYDEKKVFNPLFIEASLLRGCLAELSISSSEGKRIWAESFRKLRDATAAGIASNQLKGSRRELIYFIVLAGLSGELQASDMPGIRAKVLDLYAPLLSNSIAAKTFVEIAVKDLDSNLLSSLWSTERGSEFARRVAMGKAVFPDIYRVPVELITGQIILDGTLGQEAPNAGELQLIDKLTSELVSAKSKGRLSILQLAGLVAAWNGLVDVNGWREMMKTLPPSFSRPLVYVLARRLIRLGKPKIAQEMLLEFVKDVASDDENDPVRLLSLRTLETIQKNQSSTESKEPYVIP